MRRLSLNLSKEESFKTDACISIPDEVAASKASGDICLGEISVGKYAVAYFEINGKEIEKAWQTIYSQWLPNSGYLPDDRSAFERYLNDPKLHPENKLMVEFIYW